METKINKNLIVEEYRNSKNDKVYYLVKYRKVEKILFWECSFWNYIEVEDIHERTYPKKFKSLKKGIKEGKKYLKRIRKREENNYWFKRKEFDYEV